MTDSDVDRVLRVLTEFRIDSADRFGRLEEQIKALGGIPVEIEKLWGEVTALKLKSASVGRFTWGDVLRVATGLAAVSVVLGAIVAAVRWAGA